MKSYYVAFLILSTALCYNVEDMVSVLKERKVDGLLVDTYVAGANKELFSEFFRIRKIFDHKFCIWHGLGSRRHEIRDVFHKIYQGKSCHGLRRDKKSCRSH